MPDSATMCESINPKSRPRNATPPSLTDVDVVDETPLRQLTPSRWFVFQNDALKRVNDTEGDAIA